MTRTITKAVRERQTRMQIVWELGKGTIGYEEDGA
jgi:hypothetical protein